MNPSKIDQMLSDLKAEIANGRERSLVVTKLDEAELWLLRCTEIPAEVSNG